MDVNVHIEKQGSMSYRMSEFYVYQCELDIALTHALSSKRSRKQLALESLRRALLAAIRLYRLDLAHKIRELISIINR